MDGNPFGRLVLRPMIGRTGGRRDGTKTDGRCRALGRGIGWVVGGRIRNRDKLITSLSDAITLPVVFDST